jgi:recombinational DNA repair protein RecR
MSDKNMEMSEREYHTVKGIIESKQEHEGKGPCGHIYIDGEKYTCWSETYWKSFVVGEEVELSYIEKTNEYNGKTYVNKNISHMKNDKEIKKTPFSETSKKQLEDKGFKVDKLSKPQPVIESKGGIITIGALKYAIKDIKLELITGQ